MKFQNLVLTQMPSVIGGGNGTASTATAIPMFDKWRLTRTKASSA